MGSLLLALNGAPLLILRVEQQLPGLEYMSATDRSWPAAQLRGRDRKLTMDDRARPVSVNLSSLQGKPTIGRKRPLVKDLPTLLDATAREPNPGSSGRRRPILLLAQGL